MSSLSIRASIRRGDFYLELSETLELDAITAVFGKSGSGKTSLLRLIAGLDTVANAAIGFSETSWQNGHESTPTHLRRVGYVFQDSRLFTHLSVRGNLEYALRHSPGDSRIEFDEVVETLALAALLGRRPDELSGGECQRVAMARALMGNPRLLLMDEPMSSLDIGSKRELIPFIEQLPARFLLPVIYVTHDPDEVTRLAKRMIVLERGRVVARGTPAEVFSARRAGADGSHLDIGSVISCRVEAHVQGMTELSLNGQRLRVPQKAGRVGESVRLRIRSRDVVVATVRPAGMSIRNVLEARLIELSDYAEAHVELRLAVGDQALKATITRHAADELGLTAGQKLFALVKAVAFDTAL